jgi:hypothetical protein
MKIAIITTLWKRHDLTKIMLNYYKEVAKPMGYELICAGSEGDISRELADGWHYIETENYPVSEKHNKLLEKAKELKVDGVVLIGSDDLLCENVLKFYQKLSAKEANVIGFKGIYFYETENENLYYWEGLPFKQTVGAGRFFSKKILKAVNYRLWNESRNRGLDTLCTEYLKTFNIFETILELQDIDGFICDIKHTENITIFAGVEQRCIKLNKKIMAKKIAKKETVKEIQELPKPSGRVILAEYEANKNYKFQSNGKFKDMPKGNIYDVDGTMANILVGKGYGEVID